MNGLNDFDDVGASAYRWEQGLSKTWETVQEDSEGNILTSVNNERERFRRAQKFRVTESVRRGLIRYLVVILDCSSASLEKDFRPSRFEAVKCTVEKFIAEYYDQNPISQLGIGVTRDRIAEKITELSGNAKVHVNALRQLSRADGLASIQNSLTLAIAMLKYIPDYGHREVLLIYNSLSTCDPKDIFTTIEVNTLSELPQIL